MTSTEMVCYVLTSFSATLIWAIVGIITVVIKNRTENAGLNTGRKTWLAYAALSTPAFLLCRIFQSFVFCDFRFSVFLQLFFFYKFPRFSALLTVW